MQTPTRIDADDLRRSVAVSEVVSRFVTLKREGAELVGLCPFHEERSPSFKVNDSKSVWKCFGCQKTGGLFDFVMLQQGLEFKEAVDWVAQLVGVSPGAPIIRPTVAAREAARERADAEKKRGEVISPVPESAPAVDFHHPKHGTPSKVWTYRDAAGLVLGYACRFETKKSDGSPAKEFIPRHFTTKGWRWCSAPTPRPLYGLEHLAAHPAASVLVVEGEKAADAARVMFPDMVVVTWPGGAGAAEKADWKALDGRRVVIWPDNDKPGRAASLVIAEALK